MVEGVEVLEVKMRHLSLVQRFLKKVEGLENGEIKVIFRNGQDERIDRSEWELTRSRPRSNNNQS